MCQPVTASALDISDARQCGESGSMTVYSMCIVGELFTVYSDGVDPYSDQGNEHGEQERPEDRTLRNA